MNDEDPFDCFGDDDDDDKDPVGASAGVSNDQNARILKRDPVNGVLAFHAGTEQALVNFVDQQMRHWPSGSIADRAQSVLGYVDDFCLQRHWMMHVGVEKGQLLRKFLKECVASKSWEDDCLTLVEIGTYCGYSAIMLAKTLTKLACNFEIFSVEVVEQNVKVSKKMAELAGLSDKIKVLWLETASDPLQTLLQRNMNKENIDFLFIDHDKSVYLSDLQDLEKAGLVKKGCYVAADNVIFAKIDDYRQYVSLLADKGKVRTRLEMSWLEYCEPDHEHDEAKKRLMKDGIGTSDCCIWVD